MKKFVLLALLVGLSSNAIAQGMIDLDNVFNTDASLTATRNGLFFTRCPGIQPITVDFNVSFYGGSDSANLILLRTLYGPTAVGDNQAGPGTFIDPTGIALTIPGATTSAFFRIDAWLGGTDYFSSSSRGTSGIFRNPLATPPNTPPDLTEMPAVIIGYLTCIPEATSFRLLGSAALVIVLFRCQRRIRSVRPRL